MTTDIEARLRAVSRAICERWNDLKPDVRDGANACSEAADTIAALKAQLAEVREALKEWKCSGCGGKGTYQQNARKRAEREAAGKPVDPSWYPDAVTCTACNGSGLNPRAAEVLRKMEKELGR